MNKNSTSYSNCEYLFKLFHSLFKQALDTFNKGDQIMEQELKRKVMDSICLTNERMNLNKKGIGLATEAQDAFECYKKECICCCDGNNLECESYLDEALKLYEGEEEIVCCINDSLNEILDLINKYEKMDDEGDYYFNKWVNCLHSEYNIR